jgi:plastocyanin
MEQAPKPAEAPSKPKSMKTMYIILGVVAIIVVAVLGLYFTGYLTGSKTVNVSILDDSTNGTDGCTNNDAACKFSPVPFASTVGSTVVWKNTGKQAHTVTFTGSNVPSPSDLGTVQPGQTVQVSFSSAGTYQYYCTIHTWMKGNVTVT